MPTRHRYTPTPIQDAFRRSEARILGYGGAMGGGKSRAICEKALEYAVGWPGCPIVICRQSHTSIKETTKKTMLEEVVPSDWIAASKSSMGEDWIEIHNGSRIHFIGLDDPVRWYSAQLGVLIVDQVEECEEDTIVKLMTRLRHPKAPVGEFQGRPMAGKVILSFNPANPGHWLQQWFFAGAHKTRFGFEKGELFAAEATKPFGDAEFFFAKATDNPYLAPGYVEQTLEALPAHLRRRYLDGIWEFISGSCYFDEEALTFYDEVITQPKYLGETEGSVPVGKKRIRIKVRRNGPVAVWEPPVRGRKDPEGRVLPAHRYVLAVDAAAGGPKGDFAAIQVVSIEDFAQVAEYQAKVEPNQLAVEAYRLGKIYNEALIVPELTGGWGFAVTSELERLGYRNIYTKRVEDRLKKIWTDKLGWDTTAKSRADMLDTLERVIREREFKLRGHRTLTELKTFVWPDKRQSEGPYKGIPQAQSGCHDDLVMALAIAVQVALSRPRQLRKPKPDRYQPQFAATGY